LGALSLIRGDLCDQGRLLGGRLGVLLCRRGLIGDSRDFGGLFLRTLRRNLAAVDNRGASGSRVLGLGLLLLGLLLFSLLGRCLLGLRSEEHTSELQSRFDLVCRLLLAKKQE